MQVTNTVNAWVNQLNFAVAQKIEQLIVAESTPVEADDEMRGFFDQLYLDLYQHELDSSVRREVIAAIQNLDNQLCRITLH